MGPNHMSFVKWKNDVIFRYVGVKEVYTELSDFSFFWIKGSSFFFPFNFIFRKED